MLLILKREWEAIDASQGDKRSAYTTIPPGEHEVERIPNPRGYAGNWLVLKGTLIGASEASWRQWSPGQIPNVPANDPRHNKIIEWGEYEVVIKE